MEISNENENNHELECSRCEELSIINTDLQTNFDTIKLKLGKAKIFIKEQDRIIKNYSHSDYYSDETQKAIGVTIETCHNLRQLLYNHQNNMNPFKTQKTINMKKSLDDIPYDLFISHYQKTGSNLALLIKNYLKEQNLEIFLDVDDMKSTHNLEKNIENSENVLLLITEGVFERHFVQLELRKALECNKNIILLWDKKNCEFPEKENIPQDLISVLDITAISWFNEKYLREPILNEIKKNINIKSNKEKFLKLINKKNNYEEIISNSYIKEYVKEIYNYDIPKSIFYQEIEYKTEFEIKKIVEINKYSIGVIMLSILIGINNDKIKINQDGNIILQDNKLNLIFKYSIEKIKYNSIILNICCLNVVFNIHKQQIENIFNQLENFENKIIKVIESFKK